MEFTEKRKKLFVSEKAIEKKGIEFFKNLEIYEVKHNDFGGFNIDGYDDKKGCYAGAGIKKDENYFFYDNSQDENVVLVKELVYHIPLWK